MCMCISEYVADISSNSLVNGLCLLKHHLYGFDDTLDMIVEL